MDELEHKRQHDEITRQNEKVLFELSEIKKYIIGDYTNPIGVASKMQSLELRVCEVETTICRAKKNITGIIIKAIGGFLISALSIDKLINLFK